MVDKCDRRAQFAGGEIPSDGGGPDDAWSIRVQPAELAVVGFASGTDCRQGKENDQADRENRQRMGDDQVGDKRPESLRRTMPRTVHSAFRRGRKMGRAKRPEDRAPEQHQHCRGQRQCGGERHGERDGDRRTGKFDLLKSREVEHSQPDDHGAGTCDERRANLGDRVAQGQGGRCSMAKLLAIARDQEQAIIRSRAEEHDHDEDLRDVDHGEPEGRDEGQQGDQSQRDDHRQGDRDQRDHGQKGRSIHDQQDQDDQCDRGVSRVLEALIGCPVGIAAHGSRPGNHEFQSGGSGWPVFLEPFENTVDSDSRFLGDVRALKLDNHERRMLSSLSVPADQPRADQEGIG